MVVLEFIDQLLQPAYHELLQIFSPQMKIAAAELSRWGRRADPVPHGPAGDRKERGARGRADAETNIGRMIKQLVMSTGAVHLTKLLRSSAVLQAHNVLSLGSQR